jgi:HK97 family phage prohead protease
MGAHYPNPYAANVTRICLVTPNTLILGGKALPATETADGDLLLEGLCVVFDSQDSVGDTFSPDAFTHSIKAFLAGSAPLCFNHSPGRVLGKVLDLTVTPAGVWTKARVDGAIREHPELRTIYEQIRRGSIKGLSCGGWFERVDTPKGPLINVARLAEISAAAIPLAEEPRFAVVSGKALVEYDQAMAELEQLEGLRAAYGRLALAEANMTVAENVVRARC